MCITNSMLNGFISLEFYPIVCEWKFTEKILKNDQNDSENNVKLLQSADGLNFPFQGIEETFLSFLL